MNKTIIMSIIAVLLLLAACSPQAPQVKTAARPGVIVQPPVIVHSEAPTTPANSDETPATTTGKTVNVDMKGFAFNPTIITINAGDTVRWTNKDSAPHDVIADDNSWTTGMLRQSDSGTVTFGKPGTYEYHCSIHPNMKATVVVQ